MDVVKKKSDNNVDKSEKQGGIEIKAYKVRWLILAIYFYYSSINPIQWIQYSSIPLNVAKYYNVSTLAVDWTAISFLALYAICFIPGSYIIDTYGLRVSALIGCLATLASVLLKLITLQRDRFWVLMISQCVAAVSQALIICLPPKVAAVWFKASEVSTACAIGCASQLFGCAVGFLIPPMIVRDHENAEDIGADLAVLSWGMVVYSVPVALATIFYFPKEPKQPPSVAQAEVRNYENKAGQNLFYETFKSILSNKGFMLHSFSASLNVAVFSAVMTLLSQFILGYFPGENEFAGRAGFATSIIGLPSTLLAGLLMDKTRKYKEIVIALNIISFGGVTLLIFSLDHHSKFCVYASCIVLGIASSAYFTAAFEFGVELTFPNEEGTTTTLLLAGTQVAGSLNTFALGHSNILIGPYWTLVGQAGLLLVATGVAAVVPNRLRRQEAQRRGAGQYEPVKRAEGGA